MNWARWARKGEVSRASGGPGPTPSQPLCPPSRAAPPSELPGGLAGYLPPDKVHRLPRVHELVGGEDAVQEGAGLRARGSAGWCPVPALCAQGAHCLPSPRAGLTGAHGGFPGASPGPVPRTVSPSSRKGWECGSGG